MKYLFQFTIIAMVAFAGEILHNLIPAPIPISVYGLVIMFALLASGLLKLEYVEEAADFFIAIMAVVFVPAFVALMEIAFDIRHSLPAIMLILMSTTVIVMAITGLSAEFVMRRVKGERRPNESNESVEETKDKAEAKTKTKGRVRHQ